MPSALKAQSADIQQQPSGKTVGIDAVSVQASGSLSQSEISGLVKTYEILEEKKLDDKTYEVKLEGTWSMIIWLLTVPKD